MAPPLAVSEKKSAEKAGKSNETKKIIKIKRFADFNVFIIDSPDGGRRCGIPHMYRQNFAQTEIKILKNKNKNKKRRYGFFPLDLSVYMTRIYKYE